MLTRNDVISMALKAGAADYGGTIAISTDALLDLINESYALGRAAEIAADCAKGKWSAAKGSTTGDIGQLSVGAGSTKGSE